MRGRRPLKDSIPTHIWDIGFGIGLFGIQVWDSVIWDIGFGIWDIWDIGFGIWGIIIVTDLERNTPIPSVALDTQRRFATYSIIYNPTVGTEHDLLLRKALAIRGSGKVC